MKTSRLLTTLGVVAAVALSTLSIGSTQAALNQNIADGAEAHSLSFDGFSPIDFSVDIISAGQGFSVALDEYGNAYSWGNSATGRLGYTAAYAAQFPQAHASGSAVYSPLQIPLPDGVRFVEISAGYQSTVARTASGDLYTWGLNTNGQLCLGDTTNRFEPTLMPEIAPGVTVEDAMVARYYTLLVGSDGWVYMCGSNAQGALGIDETGTASYSTPQRVHMDEPFTLKQIDIADDRSIFAIDHDGWLWGWGHPSRYGQTGSNDRKPTRYAPPNNVPLVDIAMMVGSSAILNENGELYTVGNNSNGQLGLGDNSYRGSYTLVPLPEGKTVDRIAGKNEMLVVHMTDGTVWVTGGSGSYGSTGTGSPLGVNSLTQVLIPEGIVFEQFAVGSQHTLVMTKSGNIYSWGSGTWGETGLGNTENRHSPELVTAYNYN